MSVGKRNETITPVQALALLNNPFMVEASRQFAERLEAHSDDVREQVSLAFRLTLSREPDTGEQDLLMIYVDRHGLENACRLIINLNEFIYID